MNHKNILQMKTESRLLPQMSMVLKLTFGATWKMKIEGTLRFSRLKATK